MKTKSYLPLLVMLMLTSVVAHAQLAINTNTYRTAIGLRAGGTSGLTIKHFFGENNAAVEGIIGVWPNALSLTALYEKHVSTGAEGLNWYYGGGGHVVFESGRYYNRDYYYYRNSYRNGGVGLGVDGIIGIEYKINPIPFAISLDLKPLIEVNTEGGTFFAVDPGLGLKLTF